MRDVGCGRALVSSTGIGAAARLEAAAGLAVAGAGGGVALLVVLGGAEPPRPGLLAAPAARRLAATVSNAGAAPAVAARGRLCVATVPGEVTAIEPLAELAAGAATPFVADVQPQAFPAALEALGPEAGALVRAGPDSPSPLVGLLARELLAAGRPVKVWRRGLGRIGGRRALAGLEPGGGGGRRARRAASRLLGAPGDREEGQILPTAIAGVLMVLVLAAAVFAIGGAATAKGRAQRAVDLAALSAARSMRDDLGRVHAPRLRPDGRPDPRHLPRVAYLRRARTQARRAARRNGIPAAAVRVRFRDAEATVPLTVAVRARLRIVVAGSRTGAGTEVAAVAAVGAGPATVGSGPAGAGAGGDEAGVGRLAVRQGRRMRADVARAFDRLQRAARAAGHELVINSAYRSDAEQARLFAANPDPRWVAPPGRSLHRCGTELDLGPASAHAWLARHAPEHGFVRRYSWEPWHFGFVRGPEPCVRRAPSARRGSPGGAEGPGDGRASGRGGLPGFVPPNFRRALLVAGDRHGVAPALLAAQLMAESGFNPAAVSPAGARGIAQFMPATAAAYGLDDPFDPGAAINAQARLMADLLAELGDPALALAAYNAGPAPVRSCGCVPPIAETRAYVARVTALLDGAGDVLAPATAALEVRLLE